MNSKADNSGNNKLVNTSAIPGMIVLRLETCLAINIIKLFLIQHKHAIPVVYILTFSVPASV